MEDNLNKKNEEEMKGLFLKNRVNERFNQRIEMFWGISICIILLCIIGSFLILYFNLVPEGNMVNFLNTFKVIFFMIIIAIIIVHYIVYRCPHCDSYIRPVACGDYCPHCGERIKYDSSLETIEKSRKESNE